MSVFKNYLLLVGLLILLVTVPPAMTVFLHYLTMLELYVRFYPLPAFILGGIVWTSILSTLVIDYWRVFRPKVKRYWVIDEKYLEEYNGVYEGYVGQEKPIIVQEVKNE